MSKKYDKAIKILSLDDDGADWPDDESEYLNLSHSTGFGAGGEFTACEIDLAWAKFKSKEVAFVTCPNCINEMRKMIAQCLKFQFKQQVKK